MEAYLDEVGHHILLTKEELSRLFDGNGTLTCKMFTILEGVVMWKTTKFELSVKTGLEEIFTSRRPESCQVGKNDDRIVSRRAYPAIIEKARHPEDYDNPDVFLTILKNNVSLCFLERLLGGGHTPLFYITKDDIYFTIKPNIFTKKNKLANKICREFAAVRDRWMDDFEEAITDRAPLASTLAKVKPQPEEGQWFLAAIWKPDVVKHLVKINPDIKTAVSYNEIEVTLEKLYGPVTLTAWEAKIILEEDIRKKKLHISDDDPDGFYELVLELLENFYQNNFSENPGQENPNEALAHTLADLWPDAGAETYFSVRHIFKPEKRILVIIDDDCKARASGGLLFPQESLFEPIMLTADRAAIMARQELLETKSEIAQLNIVGDKKKDSVKLRLEMLEVIAKNQKEFLVKYFPKK